MKVNKEYIENLFKDIVEKNIFIKGSVSNPINKKNGLKEEFEWYKNHQDSIYNRKPYIEYIDTKLK